MGWEHLEEHMGAAPNTKTPPKQEQPTPPKPEETSTVPDQSEVRNQLENTGVSQVVLTDPTVAAVDQTLKQDEGKVHDGQPSAPPSIPCTDPSHGEPSTSVVKVSSLGDHSDSANSKDQDQDATSKEEESASKITSEQQENLRKQALEEEAKKQELEA